MKLTETQIRQIINQELKNVINENQINPLHQQVKSHIKELASLATKAGQDQTLSMFCSISNFKFSSSSIYLDYDEKNLKYKMILEEFINKKIQFVAHLLQACNHILYTQMLSSNTQKVLCTTCNDNFGFVHIRKTNGISN